jgi:hypothetical protein
VYVLRLPACLAACLPAAIEMKVPKPKEGQEPRKLWIPPERLWFDHGQRIQVST